ncbi:MAG TPA: hypothetical protein VIM99_13315, partial [Blastocatellia bacterium]
VMGELFNRPESLSYSPRLGGRVNGSRSEGEAAMRAGARHISARRAVRPAKSAPAARRALNGER